MYDHLIDKMDEIIGLIIALDRQIIQGNFKQAYVITKKLSVKLSVLSDDIYMEISSQFNDRDGFQSHLGLISTF